MDAPSYESNRAAKLALPAPSINCLVILVRHVGHDRGQALGYLAQDCGKQGRVRMTFIERDRSKQACVLVLARTALDLDSIAPQTLLSGIDFKISMSVADTARVAKLLVRYV